MAPLRSTGGGDGGRWGGAAKAPGSLNEQIVVALARLQDDMQSVLERLHTLEALSASQVRPGTHRKLQGFTDTFAGMKVVFCALISAGEVTVSVSDVSINRASEEESGTKAVPSIAASSFVPVTNSVPPDLPEAVLVAF